MLGAWGGIGGLAVGLGPVIGGAVVSGISWHWIFWLNVPIGLALLPFAWRRLEESYGPNSKLDLPGLSLISVGMLGVVWGLVRGNGVGWASAEVVGSIAAGVALVVAFVLWERRAPAPMLPLRFFRNRTFTTANLVSLFMYFGMFGAVFLLSQFLQTAQGYSPLQAGLRVLPWTGMPLLVAPIAGMLSVRIGGRPLMAVGMALQGGALAWLAAISTPAMPYSSLVAPFAIAGIGMGLFFAPVANIVLSAVRPEEEGQASVANNAIREIGGVFGVAALATIFSRQGGYGSPQAFVDGLVPAVYVGAGVVGAGALAALALPRWRGRSEAMEPGMVAEAQPAFEPV